MSRFNTFTWYQSRHISRENTHQIIFAGTELKTKKMEFPKEFILSPYNFFAWKEKMIMHLQGRGFYRLTMNTKT